MGNKIDFYFDSADGCTKIHAVRFVPDGEIKAILQISHGRVEFIDRYTDFALYLNKQGILVTGNDHLGHGSSIKEKANYGYFAEKDGNGVVLRDLHTLTLLTKEKYPGIPYYLLGHSMGSFFARQYLCSFGDELDGAIIMGTGNQPFILAKLGVALTWIMAKFKGWRYRSIMIDNMAFGGYNKRFQPPRTDKDWLTKDEKIVDDYIADERCSFIFTLNAYHNMFKGIAALHKKALLCNMPRNLPVFFVAGEDDPVGDFGRGVTKVAESFIGMGMENVKIKLYPKDRQEILNELDRDIVYNDIYNWIESLKIAPINC